MIHHVTVHVDPYGDFKARVRDFETTLRIALRADEQMSVRGFDPNKTSQSSQNLFSILALFTETCDEPPGSFSVTTLLEQSPLEALDFLVAYQTALEKAEERFRGGIQETS
jgi:polysaccharide pyruvyl transferase WcaK-like protein